MDKLTVFRLLGTVISIITIILTIYWYDWKLALVIFLAIFANNLEQFKK